MKYRKKQVEVEAMQFKRDNIKEVLVFMGKLSSVDYIPTNRVEEEKFYEYCENCFENGIQTHTLEGDIRLRLSDFIIKGVKGEFYPCRADIFEMTYEKYS